MATLPILQQEAPASGLGRQILDFSERAAAALLLAGLSPIICLSGALLAVFARRSPFIAHRRVGWGGNPLWMLKLRTMRGEGPRRFGWVEYIDDQEGPESKQPGDARVLNAFAAFCRRHSLDELPQLIHVVRGEMSLVGPRPLTSAELRRHYGPAAREVLDAKPGMAGLWQISGRNRLSYSERCNLDLELVRQRSAGMYFRILLRTIPEVLRGGNSW